MPRNWIVFDNSDTKAGPVCAGSPFNKHERRPQPLLGTADARAPSCKPPPLDGAAAIHHATFSNSIRPAAVLEIGMW